MEYKSKEILNKINGFYRTCTFQNSNCLQMFECDGLGNIYIVISRLHNKVTGECSNSIINRRKM